MMQKRAPYEEDGADEEDSGWADDSETDGVFCVRMLMVAGIDFGLGDEAGRDTRARQAVGRLCPTLCVV